MLRFRGMKMRAYVEVKKCPTCRREKDRNGNPIRHHAKGVCKACYMAKFREDLKKDA